MNQEPRTKNQEPRTKNQEPRNMNILILNWRDVSHPLSGGAEIVTMEHAKRWVAMGHTVTWFTSWYPEAKQKEVVEGVYIIRRAGSLTVYLHALWYMLFRGNAFDVIVDEVHGFPFFSPLVTKKPVVVFIHEIAGEIWDFMYPFPINVIGKYIEKHYFRFYKHCLFWTDAESTVHELVERGIPKEQCIAIPCPIILDTKFLDPSSLFLGKNTKKQNDTNQYLRTKNQELRTKNKEPTYIFVSRVVKMKGIEEVIKAFSFIIRSQPQAALWIVGGGEVAYREKLQRMIADYNVEKHVCFLGKVPEEKKVELMKKAHILLHASVKEGWGLVVLEAASVGTPAVVYDVPGLRDVVKNEKTGVVLSENSPKEMAKQAILLYKDKHRYAQYQKEGNVWVNSLSWKDVAEESLMWLEKAIVP